MFQRLGFLSNALSLLQILEISNKFTQFERNFTGGLNTKNFHSMRIMHELPTNNANFLIKTTQDFN